MKLTKTELVTLSNGVRLVLVDTPGLQAATVEVFLEIGSKWEEREEWGYSHFLEHLAFKGSKKWPKPDLLFKELDGKGVSYNASTGLEATSYYIKCLPKDVLWANELLADILINPIFDSKEVEKEKGVVLEEMAMYEDNPMMGLESDFSEKYLVTKDGRGCFNIIGKKNTIATATVFKVDRFRKKYINANRVVIVVCGDRKKLVSSDILKMNVEKEWKSLDQSDSILPSVSIGLNQFRTIKEKGLEQAHAVVAWPSIEINSPKRYVAKLVEILLCGNFSSRLVSLLREEMGIAYYVHPSGEQMKEVGFMGIQTGIKKDRLEEVIYLILNEISLMKDRVTLEQINQAKEYLMGTTRLMMDKTQFWSDFIGQHLLGEGKLVDLEKELLNYLKVEEKEVKEFCEEFLNEKKVSYLAVR